MNTAQRIRCILLVVVMLVMVSVFVVYRREPPRVSDAFDERPLILRKNLALQIGDRAAAENQQFVPIPDNAVPIRWDRVERSHQAVNRTVPPLPSPMVPPRDPRDAIRPEGHVDRGPQPHGNEHRSVGQRQPPVEPRYHRIVDGETLRDIAAQYLGSPDRFMELFYANRAVLPHPDVLPLGARIVIPEAHQPIGSLTRPALPSLPIPPSTPSPRSPEPAPPPDPNRTPWRSRTSRQS